MIKNITMFFLSPYANAPVETREKAKLFLYLITSSLAFITILFIVLNTLMELTVTNYIIFGLCLGLVVSLTLLRKGRYHGAVNFFSLLFTAAIIFLGFYGQIGRGRIDYITNFYFFPVIIIYTALFCRPSWIIFTTTLLLICGVASYLLNYSNPIGTQFMPVAQSALVDYTSSVVLTLLLCVTIIKLNGKITEAARREEHTRELHAELEIARLIQSNLMPETPAGDPRISIFATYIPMEEIGGDFYDFHSSGDELHIFIADVSGHGIPGAFMALITKVALLHAISGAGATTEVLHRINEVLCDCTVMGNFVSCFYCRIDKAAKTIRYTSAGHIPQLLYRREDSSFRELYSKGMAMGWAGNIALNEETIDLEAGDRLILFTDGVTECMNARREMYSDTKLRDFISRNRDLPVEAFSRGLIKSLVDFSRDETFNDDLTLITIDIN
ncbi:MAG: serine/threonine-protein phosphatase [Spirochaetes bacterium]|nr:serine/threonine-protein phosphatase [Spirochaetota bacterium]